MTIDIDLRPIAEQIPQIVADGIADVLQAVDDERADAAADNGGLGSGADPQVSAFGLYVGIQGLFCVIQADDANGLGGRYGRDGAGEFCNNMPDWRWYLSEHEFEGPHFRNFPHQEDELMIIGPSGERLDPADVGDRVVYDLLADIIRPVLAEFLPFGELPRTTPFRVGIQPIGGNGEFWLLRGEPDPLAQNPFDRWVAEVTG